MSRKIFILLAGLLLASCQSTEEPAAPQPYSRGIRIRLQYEGYAMAESRLATRLDTDYDRVEFGVADLAGNIIENLKKTRNVRDRRLVNEYIDACFAFIRSQFPDYPQCRYPIRRQKHDWIYMRPATLKLYLSVRKLLHR